MPQGLHIRNYIYRDMYITDTLWNSTYEAHRSHFVDKASQFLGDYSTAEDVVQDAFVSVATRRKGPSDLRKVKEYLDKAVKIHCILWLRQNRPSDGTQAFDDDDYLPWGYHVENIPYDYDAWECPVCTSRMDDFEDEDRCFRDVTGATHCRELREPIDWPEIAPLKITTVEAGSGKLTQCSMCGFQLGQKGQHGMCYVDESRDLHCQHKPRHKTKKPKVAYERSQEQDPQDIILALSTHKCPQCNRSIEIGRNSPRDDEGIGGDIGYCHNCRFAF